MATEGTSSTETEQNETVEGQNETVEGQNETDEGQRVTKPADGVPAEVKAALRKANKEAETLRLRLKDLEDRDKTETQRLTDRVEAAEKAASGHEATALRLSVAFDKGLTAQQAKRLVGTSRDELEADADEIRRDFPTPPGTVRPVDQGPRGRGVPASPQEVFSQFMRQNAS